MPRTGYCRIAVRLPEEDDILLEALEEIVKSIAAETEE
jgi:histidinol-phosphate/aromatic aminotransferase/cobyric acid decarboxylase-like protein